MLDKIKHIDNSTLACFLFILHLYSILLFIKFGFVCIVYTFKGIQLLKFIFFFFFFCLY